MLVLVVIGRKLTIFLSVFISSSAFILAPTNTFAAINSLNGLTGATQTFQDDTNVTISSAGTVHSLGWQGLLGISRGGTNASSFTDGSIFFFDGSGSAFSEDNSNLFWDNTNKRLGVGTSSPTTTLDVAGTAQVTSLISTNDASINSLTVGFGGGSVSTNTAVGANALVSNTTGSENAGFGSDALHFNDTGNRNVAVGFRSLGNNIDGSENAALGWDTLIGNITGGGNVAIGRNAASLQADGVTDLANAHDSVYIGKAVRGFDDNDNGSIVIGADAIGAGANKAVIGNSSMTDIYFGSDSANANSHALTLYSGSSTVPGCIVMGDTAGGVGYVTLVSGVLTVSSIKPSACQ